MGKIRDFVEDAWDIVAVTPYYRVRRFIKDTPYKLKWKWQRAMRGYSDSDVWNMFGWFITTVEPMLKDLLESHYGYPGDMTNEEFEDKLRELLKYIDGMKEREYEEEMTVEDIEEGYKMQCENKDKFFKLFSELFYALWD